MKKLLIVLTLILTLIFPVMAFAEPGDEATDPADAAAEESVNITMEYRYSDGEEPVIPDTITQAGITYHLISKAEPVLESTLPRMRTYTYKIDGAISKKDLAEIEKIPGLALTPAYVELEREVDKKDVIKNLPNNDVDYLPTSKEFEVSSASGKNAVQKEELERAGVTYKVEARDEWGFPSKYTATVVYRGTETYSDIGYYTAKLSYETQEQIGSTDQWVIVATYAPEELYPGTDSEVEEEPAVADEPAVPDVNTPEPGGQDDRFANQTGNIFVDLANGNVPLGSIFSNDAWSILSMLLSLVALIISAVLVIGTVLAKGKKGDVRSNEYIDRQRKRGKLTKAAAIAAGILTPAVWISLDSLSKPMAWINRWTIIVGAVFIVHIVLLILYRTRKNAGRAFADGEDAAV
jgi:preprotein translocase subunit SecG